MELTKALDIIQARVASEIDDETFDLTLKRYKMREAMEIINRIVGNDNATGLPSLKFARQGEHSGFDTTLRPLKDSGDPIIFMHVRESSKPGIMFVQFAPLADTRAARKDWPRATYHIRIEREASIRKLTNAYKAACNKFRKLPNVVLARTAGEVQHINSIRKELPREFSIGNMKFKIDGFMYDQAEFREVMRWVATVDDGNNWKVRLHVYKDDLGTGHSVIHDERWPIQYYVGLSINDRKADIIEGMMKPCSVKQLLDDITVNMKKFVKSGVGEISIVHKMADKKAATEFMKKYAELIS
jgi:hypothetical protein